MIRSLRGLVAAMAALCALASTAHAQNITIKDGNGSAVTMCTLLSGGVNTTCVGAAAGAFPVGSLLDLGSGGLIHQDLTSLISVAGASLPAGSANVGSTDSPCTKVVPINISASADVYTSTNKIHVCAGQLQSSVAQAVSIVEGTGSTCATGTAAVAGGTTADSTHGFQLFAGQDIPLGTGLPTMKTQTTADHLCILLGAGAGGSSTGLLSGWLFIGDY